MGKPPADFSKLSDNELYKVRNDAVEALADLEMEVIERRKRKQYLIKDIFSRPWEKWSDFVTSFDKKSPILWKPLISPTHGFPIHNFYSFLVQVPPKFRQESYHIHGEAIKLYTRGKGIEHIGDQTFEVTAGDAILIPANEWHGTENPYDEPIEFYGTQMLDGTYLQQPARVASA
jgi:mannose-6-phosphate isomerase-like protein (cupin superfamily)